MSDDKERYNFFNGMYASMLFLNDYEYTLNATSATSTCELIAGFTEFWHCMQHAACCAPARSAGRHASRRPVQERRVGLRV